VTAPAGKPADGGIRDPDTRRTREAEVDIYEPMLNYIEDNAFARRWRFLCITLKPICAGA
jgi:hypothetical protein